MYFTIITFTIAAVVLVTGNNTTQNETQTQTQTVNITVFGVEMGASVTIWQNNNQTDQTFFRTGWWLNDTFEHGKGMDKRHGLKQSFPFLNHFTINNRSFTVPTTGVFNFSDSVYINGLLRDNFYYGFVQFVDITTSEWKLYSVNLVDYTVEYIVETFLNVYFLLQYQI